jgi:bifunctional DNA-binding transcriptional regulator/antitoxin component of YhaV-PrlF toxin-antitoxin module
VRTRSWRYAVAAVDDRGRVIAAPLLRALGWSPGTPITVGDVGGLLVVTTADGRPALAPCRVTSAGDLRLAAPVRHWYGLSAGSRVLLIADPDHGRLVIHSPARLDAMLVREYAGAFGGEVP